MCPMTPPPPHGLATDGTIQREGDLSRIDPDFAPMVQILRTQLPHLLGEHLHSVYLYGSIPRGTATPGISDLDALAVLHNTPTDTDRTTVRALETELDRRFCQINGAGILLHSILSLTSPAERHDGGFFLACLCTPLLGPDLAQHLPRYRPTSLLARQTNGDLEQLLPRWHHRLALAHTPEQRRHLCRTIARRLVRTGFTLIMPTWKGWTSDLDESAHLFATHHPERAEQMYTAAHLAHHPSHEPADLNLLLHDLAPWLAHTYTATHGTKT